jgi:hypothetical protein
VAKVAEIGSSVATYLKAAGQRRGGQVRYPKVAREYDALGHEAFVHRYLTPRLRADLIEAIDAKKRAHDAKRLAMGGIPANHMRYCRIYRWLKTVHGTPAVFRIEDHRPHGFLWRNLKPYFDQPEWPPEKWAELKPRGDDDDNPFANPLDCYRFCLALFQPLD